MRYDPATKAHVADFSHSSNALPGSSPLNSAPRSSFSKFLGVALTGLAAVGVYQHSKGKVEAPSASVVSNAGVPASVKDLISPVVPSSLPDVTPEKKALPQVIDPVLAATARRVSLCIQEAPKLREAKDAVDHVTKDEGRWGVIRLGGKEYHLFSTYDRTGKRIISIFAENDSGHSVHLIDQNGDGRVDEWQHEVGLTSFSERLPATNNPELQLLYTEALDALDHSRLCTAYYKGKKISIP